ncbi:MAG: aminotransferase class III-fold pyridoxal phosphate-dependent enzyme [Vibrio sp.]
MSRFSDESLNSHCTFTQAINPISAADLEFDSQHIWHPYTSATKPLPCYPVTCAQGEFLYLDDGTALVDGMSSWWAAIHGYNHPQLNQAMHSQIDKMSHVMFGGITHQSAIELCKRLIRLTSANLEHVFISDSGSVAVEVSLKMALQYWQAKGENRHQFLTLRQGYHGDTFAAMSVTDPDNSMHSMYRGFLPKHHFAPSPQASFGYHAPQTYARSSDGQLNSHQPNRKQPSHKLPIDDAQTQNALLKQDIAGFEDKLKQHHQQIAAVILEPIVQGAGGMRFYSPAYLQAIRKLCDRYQVLLILDEIATGFGRTGKLFAYQHAGIEADILCVGKALTGGYMSLAATLCSQDVAHTISQGASSVFMHGPTFMGNPLACAVANQSLALIEAGDWQQQVAAIEQHLIEHLLPLSDLAQVKQVRVLGAIGVVETHQPVDMAKIQAYFVKQGVWIRPFGRLIYIMPPYIIKPESLKILIHAIRGALVNPALFIR